jgi:hypothetical protein
VSAESLCVLVAETRSSREGSADPNTARARRPREAAEPTGIDPVPAKREGDRHCLGVIEGSGACDMLNRINASVRRSTRCVSFSAGGDDLRHTPSRGIGQDCTKASRSALIVSAWVVGIPCGNPLYVLSVPFCASRAGSGPESA